MIEALLERPCVASEALSSSRLDFPMPIACSSEAQRLRFSVQSEDVGHVYDDMHRPWRSGHSLNRSKFSLTEHTGVILKFPLVELYTES